MQSSIQIQGPGQEVDHVNIFFLLITLIIVVVVIIVAAVIAAASRVADMLMIIGRCTCPFGGWFVATAVIMRGWWRRRRPTSVVAE